MSSFEIKNILIPTDFSKTGLLAVEHAAFMARLYKADLYLLHVIEISETTYSIYDPAIVIPDLGEVEKIATNQLENLAIKLRKEYAITVNTICSRGRPASEVVAAVNDKAIDVVVMGTHGANGFNEYFIGSNAHKTVTICPCPVITIQSHAKKLGFSTIVLPIDDSLHSRQKVDYAIALAKKYAATIHILGLTNENVDIPKFEIKIDAVEKAIKNAGLLSVRKVVKGDSLAVEAIKYSKNEKADLIVVLTDHESRLTGMFLGAFAKQIVNHSKIPVMSIRPVEGHYESLSLSGSNPF